MYFVGIDLAWSPKNRTGIAVLAGTRKKAELVSCTTVLADEEIVQYIRDHVGNAPAFVGIDAPLIVPNQQGRRVAEEITGMLFRKYNAGAHPANRERLGAWSGGKIRGEELTKLLEKEGFVHNPDTKAFEQSRKVFEVYPHPSMVVLFNLERVIPYKNKPGRDQESRWQAFATYQKHMCGLAKARPTLVLPDNVAKRNVRELIGKKLKDYEDTLDAVFCAYVAQYAWARPQDCAVLGNMREGYIFTPVFGSMHQQLKGIASQRSLGDF